MFSSERSQLVGIVAVGRVGQERVAIGHRELGGLDAEVDPAGIVDTGRAERVRRRRLEAAEQARGSRGRSRPSCSAGGWSPGRRDSRCRSVPPGRALGAQVGGGDRRAGRGQSGALARRELALVQVVEAGGREALQRPGEGRQADDLTGPPAAAMRPVDRGPARAAVRQVIRGGIPLRAHLDRVDVAVPGREAGRRQLDRGPRIASRESRPCRAWAAPQERTAPGRRDRPRADERQGR